MKKIGVLAVVAILLLCVAALLYKTVSEGGKAEKTDAGLEERIKQMAAEDAEPGQDEKPLDSFDPKAGSYEARVYFCREAVRRVVSRGIDLLDREVSSAVTLISPGKVLQYYTCKAAEDLDARWCDKLAKLPEGAGYDINLRNECIRQYRGVAVASGWLEGWPQPSIEKFEKKLAGKPYSSADELLKTARPVFARSPEACSELGESHERMACLMFASPEDPPQPPEEADAEAKNFFYTFMAFRKNDPAWLERTSGFDLFSVKKAFTPQPYCDAAFKQMADMFCIGEKQESFE